MTLSDQLLVTILAALVVALTTATVRYFINRSRLRAALLSDIRLHLAGANKQCKAVERLVAEQICEGQTIPFPISYSVGEYLLYKSLQSDLPKYLQKRELVKTIKFYHAIWELDVSFHGLAETLMEWQKTNTVLTSDHVKHIKRQRDHIQSLTNALKTSQIISHIEDFPDEYHRHDRDTNGKE